MSRDLLSLAGRTAASLVLLTICVSLTRDTSAASTAEPVNCDSVKYRFSEKPPSDEYPQDAFSGVMTVCGDGPCCTEAMQKQLSYQSKRQFDTGLRQELENLANVLLSRAIKFDAIFKEMMTKAKSDFHSMFKKTYGIIYEQNSYVFTDLFDELEKYYSRGQIDLIEAMDNFFNTLYQKMFTVLNQQYKFDAKYLECVSEKMKELKPFGDVPDKLSVQLKRSFVATRTFSQALTISGNIVKNMQNIAMTSSCYRAVAKMTHCPACSGLSLTELKPCSNYCSNVMKGCLAYHSQLDSHWNDFIVEMEKVIDRLLGPFNIEMVVEPINIKISEAIMNFQENSVPVSQSVFAACGKPILGRARRDTSTTTTTTPLASGEIPFETLEFSSPGKKGRKQFQQPGADGLEKVIKEAKTRLKDTKNFWKKLPYHMCGTSKSDQLDCWNGLKKDKYVTPVVGDGMSNQQNNPEVSVEVGKPNSLVNEQVYALKTITGKLKTAFMGHDVEWFDTDDTIDGSGSGYGPDDEDSEDVGSGSSGFPTENEPEPPTSEKEMPTPSHRPNEEDNRLYPIPEEPGRTLLTASNSTNMHTSAAAGRGDVMLNKAVLSYIMPIIIVWYLECVSEKMKELKPFGDVPDKLSVQLKRSFVATRTFSQALTISGNIVKNMQNIAMTSSCYRAVAKMTHCPACSGLSLTELKPCSNYCSNVMKGCLAYHSQLDSHWNDFIVEMEKVIDRLLGPFNIEMVVEPINIKISEAIMNFQENSVPVSQSVFAACGKPILGRARRDTSTTTTTTPLASGEIPFETLEFSSPGKKGRKQFQQPGADGLEKVIKEAKTRLKDTKNFWKKLPYHMCGTSKSDQLDCWNGLKKDKYVTPVVGDGMSNQQNNPEVSVEVGKPNSLVNEQVYALKTITGKLKTAFMGHDVEWFDTDDTIDGSGSGYGPDDEDSEDVGSGSSGFPTENEPEPPTSEKEMPTPSHRPNEEDNRLYPIPEEPGRTLLTANNSTNMHTSAAAGRGDVMLNKAILSYIMPIIIVWFGSSVSDMWH